MLVSSMPRDDHHLEPLAEPPVQASCGVGTGLALINNIPGHVIALGGKMGGQVVFVSLFSVANAAGELRGRAAFPPSPRRVTPPVLCSRKPRSTPLCRPFSGFASSLLLARSTHRPLHPPSPPSSRSLPGRLIFGYVSELYLHSSGTHRTTFLVIASFLMTAFSAFMAIASLADLYVLVSRYMPSRTLQTRVRVRGPRPARSSHSPRCLPRLPLSSQTLLGGLAFGGHWAIIPTLISDVFGLKNYASIYAVVQVRSPPVAFACPGS